MRTYVAQPTNTNEALFRLNPIQGSENDCHRAVTSTQRIETSSPSRDIMRSASRRVAPKALSPRMSSVHWSYEDEL